LFDSAGQESDIRDHVSINSNFKTDILIRNLETGSVIAKVKNKVVLPGAGLIARNLFDISTG
jgi:hypothetical protein